MTKRKNPMTHSNQKLPALSQAPATSSGQAPGVTASPVAQVASSAPSPSVSQPKEVLDPLLHRILSTRRCHGSKGDSDFRIWLHAYIKSLGYAPEIRVEGVITAVTDVKSTTLFSCHVDTCHSAKESDGTQQALAFDPTMGHLMLLDKKTSGCLGADDGAGIYIMLKMMEAKVPGSYIFNTGEEKGGIGSRAFLSKNQSWLENFDRAIAFDRADNFEVICTQGGSPCASVVAGAVIAKAFTDLGLPYEVSHKGSFTDTKIYAKVIPECFNMGVGYMHQHSPSEYLDVDHLEAFVAAAIKVEWSKIPTVRKIEAEPAYQRNMFNEDFYGATDNRAGVRPASPFKGVNKPVVPSLSLMEELESYTYDDFVALVEEEPTIASDLLCLLFAKKKALQLEVDVLNRFFT